MPDLTDEEIGEHRLRHVHRRAVLRRHGPGHRVPRRPRPDRDCWSRRSLPTLRVDADEGRALHARSTAARRSRSTAGSSSGAGSRSRRWAAGRASSMRSTARAERAGISVRYERPRHRARSRRRRRARRAGAAQDGTTQDIPADAVVLAARRLPGERRVAHPLPRPRLGPREGARHALQHRRRHQHGARHRRAAGRQLVGLPRGRLGPQRARVRRPARSATASRSTATRSGSCVNADGERFVDEGADFRNYTYAKYGREVLLQPRPVRLAGVRRQGAAPAARRVPHQAGHQGDRRHARGAVAQARRRRPGGVPRHREALQRGRRSRTIPFNPNVKDGRGHRRPARPRKSNWANVLDTPPFEAYRSPAASRSRSAACAIDPRTANVLDAKTATRSPACTRAASWSAACSTSTIRAAAG